MHYENDWSDSDDFQLDGVYEVELPEEFDMAPRYDVPCAFRDLCDKLFERDRKKCKVYVIDVVEVFSVITPEYLLPGQQPFTKGTLRVMCFDIRHDRIPIDKQYMTLAFESPGNIMNSLTITDFSKMIESVGSDDPYLNVLEVPGHDLDYKSSFESLKTGTTEIPKFCYDKLHGGCGRILIYNSSEWYTHWMEY